MLSKISRTALISLIICLMLAAAGFAAQSVSFAAEMTETDSMLYDEAAVDGVYDPDDQLEQYVSNRISELTGSPAGRTGASLRKSRGARLTGNNKIVYDLLKAEIEKVASGERPSTEILIPLEHLTYEDTARTAEDLGVESLLVDGRIPQEIIRLFVNDVFEYDPRLVMIALVTDMPYEFYWFDKTAGYTFGFINRYTVNKSGTKINFADSDSAGNVYDCPTLAFNLRVSADYSETGEAGTFLVDADKVSAANEAAANAAEIVEENLEKPDCCKLYSYCNAICALTDYDKSASVQDNYGNTWQLIYVFDGDPETKVVCEGYAKAFQLLCDKTEFDNEEIECRTVYGSVITGAHMWNVLHMEDGRNYLADVTNCDRCPEYSAERLFLKGYDSVVSGFYRYSSQNGSSWYQFDTDMASIYSPEELEMAETDYQSAHAYGDWKWESGPSVVGESVHSRTCAGCGIIESKSYQTDVTGISAKTYSGKPVSQAPVVTFDGKVLKEGVDYILSYSRNVSVGTGTVTIKGIGDFMGARTVGFNINPKGRGISRLTRAKRGFTVKWRRQPAKMNASRITGYQIQYSLSKSFSKSKTVTVKGWRKTYRKITKLTSRKKYYVRMRTYMVKDSKTYYSAWCGVKSVKTK